MPLENEMKKPKNFTSTFGVLNVAMLSIAIIYAMFGFFGYVKYGKGANLWVYFRCRQPVHHDWPVDNCRAFNIFGSVRHFKEIQ